MIKYYSGPDSAGRRAATRTRGQQHRDFRKQREPGHIKLDASELANSLSKGRRLDALGVLTLTLFTRAAQGGSRRAGLYVLEYRLTMDTF